MTQAALIPDVKKQSPKKSDTPHPGETHRLIKLYCDLYKDRYGEAPLITAKAAGILKRVLALAGPVLLEERLRFFMRWNDAFVVDGGHDLCLIESQWQKMIAASKASQRGVTRFTCTHTPPCRDSVAHGRRQILEMKR